MRHVILALSLVGAGTAQVQAGGESAPGGAASEPSEACIEAEARYQELFGTPTTEVQGATVILMYDYQFCPPNLTVAAGDTVRWVNVDKRTSHSVIVGDGPESDRAFPEESLEHVFSSAGDYRILCGPHWERRDMIGNVFVEK